MNSVPAVKWLRAALIVSCAFVALQPAMAQDDSTPLTGLMAALSELDTLSGRFEQQTLSGSGEPERTLDGEFHLQRPDRLYWYTEPPYEQAIYADGDTLWIHEVDLFQATRQPLEGQFEQSPALIFTGTRDQIAERYSVSVQRESQTQVRYALAPRGNDSMIQHLSLEFESGLPESLTLVDSFDQETRIRFSELTVNEPVDPAVFRFDPPQNVDVLEQLGR